MLTLQLRLVTGSIFLAYDAVRMRIFKRLPRIRAGVPIWHSFEIVNVILEAPEFRNEVDSTVSRETH
jgi:hypothetical protein